jgi:hypothetical protein
MYVSKGLGNGRFGAPTVAGGVGGWAAQHGVVADLDCDGALDLLPLNFGYSLPLYGDGRGSFTRDFRAYLYLQSNFQKAKFDVADLDRDGRLDFVSLNEDSLYLDIILPWNG